MKTSKVEKVLITGASAGIGAIYADRLSKRGLTPILVARNKNKLEQVAERILKASGLVSEILVADLETKSGRKIVEEKIKSDSDIVMLVNNAGIGSAAPLTESNLDDMESMVEINVTALMRLAQVASIEFSKRSRGAIVNISSIVAISPEVLNGVYGGTKAFVLGLTQSMHHELASQGIKVQAVLPGATRTDFWDNSGLPIQHLPQEIVMSAEDMVDAALVGFDAGEVVTIPALEDFSQWEKLNNQRVYLKDKISAVNPASRYVR